MCMWTYRFTFPAVLLVYYMVSPILLDVEFLIRLIGQDKLFCSSKDLLYVLEHSTAYCYFSGEYDHDLSKYNNIIKFLR